VRGGAARKMPRFVQSQLSSETVDEAGLALAGTSRPPRRTLKGIFVLH
jgi:hypothetical protein